MAQGPCLNPNCSSHGAPHPNCRCYSRMAQGGIAGCNGPHKTECVYHMAEGGEPEELPADPETSLTQSIIHHGLSGALQSTGQVGLAKFEPEHMQPLMDAKNNFTPVQVESGHPLVGQIPKSERDQVIRHLSAKVMMAEPNAEGFRSASDHLKSSYRGKQLLNEAVGSVFNKGSFKVPNSDTSVLQSQLDDLQANPAKALEMGGSLGHYLPDHSGQFAATVASAMNYFQQLKPKNTDMGPLSEPISPNKQNKEMYKRQLEIAQQPLTVLKRVKEGSLVKQDVTTLQTIYPKMYNEMVSKVGEELINLKSEKQKVHIPYKRKLALSTFLGQPMDASLNGSSLVSIMKANAPQQPPQPQSKSKRPTGPAITQMSKNAEKYETATQQRENKGK